MRHCTFWIWSLLAVSLAAQGGSLTSFGIEPRLTLTGRAIGAPAEFLLTEVPATGSAYALVGPSGAAIPLASLGLAGTLGVDPMSASLVGPLPLASPGSARVAFLVPGSLLGSTLWVQGFVAETGGLALSDAQPWTFGTSQTSSLLLPGLPGMPRPLVRFFADASSLGPVAAELGSITLQAVELASTFDTGLPPLGRPWNDRRDPTRPRILLPDGSGLIHYSSPGGGEGLLVVDPSGSELISRMALDVAIDPLIAVSPFAPLAACLTFVPTLGSTLFLLRTDGTNFPGRAEPWIPVPFSGQLSGFEPESSSLTFLDGVLLATDQTQLVRIPLDGVTAPAFLPLPPSGGLVPIEVDEQIAWSFDGQVAAFSAGQSDELRDIYAVGVTGPVRNVTNFVAEYDDVGYENLREGGLIALSPEGSRVAFVRKIGVDEDIIVEETGILTGGLNITPPAAFGNSIESESGILFLSRTDLWFTNGLQPDQKDVYRTTLPSGTVGTPISVNVTLTSGLVSPPFSLGGTLEVAGRGSLPGNGVLYELLQTGGTERTLVFGQAASAVNTVTTNVTSPPKFARGLTDTYLAYDVTGTGRVVCTRSNGIASVVFTAPIGTKVTDVAWSEPAAALLMVLTTGIVESLHILAPSGSSTAVTGATFTSFRRGIEVLADGSFLIRTADPTATLIKVRPSTATATQLASISGDITPL